MLVKVWAEIGFVPLVEKKNTVRVGETVAVSDAMTCDQAETTCRSLVAALIKKHGGVRLYRWGWSGAALPRRQRGY